MKRWEHARLIVKLSGEKRFNRITLFGANGPKDGQLEFNMSARELGMKKDPGEWAAMDQAIADLGGEGWEMVGFTQVSVGTFPEDQDGISGSSGRLQPVESAPAAQAALE